MKIKILNLIIFKFTKIINKNKKKVFRHIKINHQNLLKKEAHFLSKIIIKKNFLIREKLNQLNLNLINNQLVILKILIINNNSCVNLWVSNLILKSLILL